MLGKEWWLFVKNNQLQWQLFKRKNHFLTVKRKVIFSGYFWEVLSITRRRQFVEAKIKSSWNDDSFEYREQVIHVSVRHNNWFFENTKTDILYHHPPLWYVPLLIFWEYKNRQRKSYQSKVLNRNKAFVSKIQLNPLRAAIDCLDLKQNTIRTVLGVTKNFKNKKT